MENALEKMPMEKRANGTSENKKRETIQEGIMDEIQHYMEFLNEVESVKELMSRLEFDFEEAEKIVENNMIGLMERVNRLAADGKFSLIVHSSMEDVLGNSVVIDMGLVKKRVLKQEINESECKKHLDRLKKSLDAVSYYTMSLCDDDNKLEIELTKENGYMEEFKDYFFEKEVSEKGEMISKKIFPKGIKKVAYFRFFNEWEQGKISQENLEEELRRLDGNFIDKKKISDDFKAERVPRANLNRY